MKTKWWMNMWVYVAVSLLLVVALAVGCAPQKPGEMTKVVLAMDWFPAASWPSFWAANVKGWFGEENLQVEFVPRPAASHRAVGEKTADFAVGGGSDVIFTRQAGMAIKAVSADVHTREFGFYGRLDKNPHLKLDENRRITDFSQLEGMTLVGYVGWNTEVVEAFLSTTGLKGKVNYVIMEPGAAIGAMMAGKIDASVCPTGVLGYFVPIPMGGWKCDFSQAGLRLYPGMAVSTHEDTIRERPEVVRAFLRAYLRGLQFEHDNPVEAVDLLEEAYTEDLHYERTLYSVKKFIELGFGTENTKGKPLGWMSEKDWGEMQDVLVKWAQITPVTRRPVSEYFTNEFLPKS